MGTTTTTMTESPASNTGASTTLAKAWDQCGGSNWQGATQCVEGCVCEKQNDYYSQCLPTPRSNPSASEHSQEGSTGSSPIEADIIVTDGDSSASQVSAWGQCGGLSWDGPTQCAVGYTCERQNDHYSQCVPPQAAAFLSRKHAAGKVQKHLQK